MRVNHWGYASSENLSNEELIKENYKGIRPAPGYPACPDHLEKATFWRLLNVEKKIGVQLNRKFSNVACCKCFWILFCQRTSQSILDLGKITQDQVKDYAKRRNITLEEANKWLNPNITN